MLEEIFWFLLILLSSMYVGYFALMYIFSKRKLTLSRKTFCPTVSLIVPTYNESKVILNKLNNILDLEYPREKLQVVVVDSASEDDTCLIVQKFLEKHKGTLEISLIPLKQRLGKASALNDVWSSCTGEIAVITDADCLLDKNAIHALVQPFGDNRVGVVTGSHVIVNPGEFATKEIEQSYRSIFNVLRLGESYLDSTIIVNGQLSFR
jgi:cellulose synthase/poly-beta-1,6-N-acetylglucosamine synthase-like glycosyltransferase